MRPGLLWAWWEEGRKNRIFKKASEFAKKTIQGRMVQTEAAESVKTEGRGILVCRRPVNNLGLLEPKVKIQDGGW